MFRTTLFALAAAAVAVALVASAQAKSTGLTGEVGPGFKIEVQKGGKDLKTIKAGTYKIKIDDKASIHNFTIEQKGGPNKKTGVAFKGDTTWTIKTLKPGSLHVLLRDPHAAMGMKGSFRVTA